MNHAVRVKDFRPLDDLETDLIATWRDVSRITYRFLVLLREFDLRQGWRAYGNNDCAEWLNWRCGIGRSTALDKVRVARALWFLPQISEAFRRGDLSYSKVRALTRVATEQNECELLDFALGVSAAQLEAFCRRIRNGDAAAAIADARRQHESRSLVRHLREDGSGTISVELPAAELELVLEALERVGRRLPEDRTRSLFAKAADALVQMARESLAGGASSAEDAGSSSECHQVMVLVEAKALSGNGGESDLPLPVVERLCCDGAIVPIVTGEEGTPLAVGRKQRGLTTAIRRALLARDRGCCTWPGCRNRAFLQAHHVHHWAHGGATDLDNLLTLCSYHHTLVHEGGFSVERHPDGSRYFVDPHGRPVERPLADAQVEDDRPVYRIVPTTGPSSSAEDGARVVASIRVGPACRPRGRAVRPARPSGARPRAAPA
ncbi:MAG TPA: DUF222 domain-containing protein [Pseudomonadales bacterium]